jgi:L-lactate permease
MQFFVSNYVGAELTDILSSLTCIVVMVAVLKFWKPRASCGSRPIVRPPSPMSRPAP